MTPTPCPMCSSTHPRLGRRRPLDALRAAPGAVARAVGRAPRARLDRRPAPAEWSVTEVLGHLLDAEVALAFRVRKGAAEPGAPIVPFHQEKWTEGLRHRQADPRRTLAAWTALRATTVDLAGRLTPAQRRGTGISPLAGPLTVDQLLTHFAEHDLIHLEQIRATLAARGRAGRAR